MINHNIEKQARRILGWRGGRALVLRQGEAKVRRSQLPLKFRSSFTRCTLVGFVSSPLLIGDVVGSFEFEGVGLSVR